MTTQYDAIGLAYESLKRLPAAMLERNSLCAALTPFLSHPASEETNGGSDSGAKVLDLACGTGYYSRLLLSWGASQVVGVDISSAMVEAAESSCSQSGISPNRLSFRVGDCIQPLVLDSGPFDVVLGAWFLNYASTPAEMRNMFANISANLKPGGHFVGITPHPALDLDAFAALHDQTKNPGRNPRKYGVSVAYTDKLDDGSGYLTKITGHVEPVEISFENFHMRREVYEKCAREGGMGGRLEWKKIVVPDPKESRERYGVEEGYWDEYNETPHLGILVIEK
ncbi:uncharacterized protein Z518_00192 [Rhinocladiella mackenziei CBS 650.93]|uniref:Rhinocladiella mackenziei CBS 650.93 unplaced genomic scaffold supercont1.1, whole genome shotgun sequence n=1 Tax=Rhinocladiella mackenziei CBS 650.93 TaxID=1442369 RepID=A0A0D2ISY4_9EURO|nr:uncharacterized protein Z518_00192 [Rhinocladiella mackenziei CBS 650.93]KIX09114.1 hypothetical protein Z518_00192 [Rhinocladiella mackenziei CBS 650.93]